MLRAFPSGPFLKSLPTTLVFDHMACPDVKQGVNGKAFQAWLKALDQNRNWITKVTCPERFTLIGLSLGGYMSLAFYRSHPERVRALLIIDTGPGFNCGGFVMLPKPVYTF